MLRQGDEMEQGHLDPWACLLDPVVEAGGTARGSLALAHTGSAEARGTAAPASYFHGRHTPLADYGPNDRLVGRSSRHPIVHMGLGRSRNRCVAGPAGCCSL